MLSCRTQRIVCVLIFTFLFLPVILLCICYLVFFCYVFTDDIRCYSPNHAYYIVEYRQLISISKEFQVGTAKLYDKTGKLLYQNDTILNGQFGPNWLSLPTRNTLFYQGLEEPGWGHELPTSPGEDFSTPNKTCF